MIPHINFTTNVSTSSGEQTLRLESSNAWDTYDWSQLQTLVFESWCSTNSSTHTHATSAVTDENTGPLFLPSQRLYPPELCLNSSFYIHSHSTFFNLPKGSLKCQACHPPKQLRFNPMKNVGSPFGEKKPTNHIV